VAAEKVGKIDARVDVRPLEGVTIVDLTAFWAGPAASHLLCTMGADVIKIESHKRPDGMRYATVKSPDDPQWREHSPTFHATNPAKRSVCVDFSIPSGRELLLRLIEGADAVIENFTPRVMDNAGLTYAELSKRRADIIVVRMPGFGVDGPWRDHGGFAQTMEQVSGVGWLTGDPDSEPIIRSTMDPVTGIHAAFALLAALEHRRRTGAGQLVEIPMVEVALNVAAEQVLTYSAYGKVLERQANRGPAAPQGVYQCAGDDRWVALAVETDDHWEALRRVMDEPDWADASDLAYPAGRRRRHDWMDRELSAWFAEVDRDEVVAELLAAGVPAAPVWDQMALGELPQLANEGFFQRVHHPVVGDVDLPGIGLRSPQIDFAYRAAAPTLGQHTAAVLRDRLGCDDDELAILVAEGAIGPV
jgi:crotonobetainyl-CoA:carnitine CoA-transferase CaiB-like acyl-CoA transferase